ncbi:hypothetical protein ARTHRO9V_150240 [Arthrobacter sp. 9V]|nr:hypothetical protein ARTHRO9V_150240 [Arthrobacter sp. 9V]
MRLAEEDLILNIFLAIGCLLAFPMLC